MTTKLKPIIAMYFAMKLRIFEFNLPNIAMYFAMYLGIANVSLSGPLNAFIIVLAEPVSTS